MFSSGISPSFAENKITGKILIFGKGKSVNVNIDRYYQILFDYSADGLLIHDSEGYITDCNQTALKLFLLEKKDLIGKNPFDFMLEAQKVKKVLHLEKFDSIKERIVQENEVFFEAELLRRNKSSFLAEVRINYIDDQNKRIFISTVRDISERQKILKRLEHNEQKYRLLFNRMDSGFALFTVLYSSSKTGVRDFLVSETNPAFKGILNISSQDIKGRSLNNIFPSDEYTDWNEIFLTVLNTGIPEKQERFFPSFGKYLTISLFRLDKQRLGMLIFDVDKMYKYQQALEKSTHFLREAQKTARIGSWEYDLVNQDSYWSDEIYHILALSPNTSPAGLESLFRQLHPEDKTDTRNRILQHFKDKTEYNLVYRIINGQGNLCFIQDRGRFIKNKDGNAERAIGTLQDITESKLNEMALRESEEKYRLLFSEIDSCFIFAEIIFNNKMQAVDAIIIDMNSAAENLLGKNKNDFSHLTLKQAFPELSEEWLDFLGKPILERRPLRITRPVPQYKLLLEMLIYPLPIGRNRLGVLFHDVREIREREEQQQQAEKFQAIGQLAGGIAHDFNNQLMGIMGYSAILTKKIQNEELRSFAAIIHRSAKRSADLTQKLLDFSRKGKKLSVPLDIHQIINEAFSILERSLHKKIELQTQCRAEKSIVLGDPMQIENAILNLGVNARDAMPEGGKIVLATELVNLTEETFKKYSSHISPGEYIHIRITDTGHGMTEDVKRRIFEPFFTTKPAGKGTGMGLAAVFGTIKAHNGAIEVSSKPGIGSCFSIFLPITDQDIAQEIEKQFKDDKEKCVGRILIVDDEEIVLGLTKRILEDCGYQVVAFLFPEKALEYYQKNWENIDMVLLDLIMPQLSGKELFLAMQKSNPKVKALVLSGFNKDDDILELLDYGICDIVPKPITQFELSCKINQILNGENPHPYLEPVRKQKSSQLLDHELKSIKNKLQIENTVLREYFIDFRKRYSFSMEKIKVFLSNNNYSGLQDFLHNIKGVALILGFSELAENARLLEKAVKNQQREEVELLLPSFEIELNHILELARKMEDNNAAED